MATVAACPTTTNYLAAAGLNASPREITFSASYTTGGEAITPAQIGLSSIAFAHANIKTPAGSTTSITFDTTTGKLKALGAAGEIANATNLSALVAEIIFFGKT